MATVSLDRGMRESARLRAECTGESHQTALRELTGLADLSALLIPAAETAEQELLEALVLAALIGEFRRHDPAEVGGPFGISRVTPRRRELLVSLHRPALPQIAAALVPTDPGDALGHGVPGLEWSVDGRDVVLHRGADGGRIVLLRTFARDWARALDAAADGPRDGSGPALSARWLDGCRFELSAMLRRIGLVQKIAEMRTHGGILEYALTSGTDGQAVLADLLSWGETAATPWVAVRAPHRVWPVPAIPSATTDPEQAVLRLAGRGDYAAATATEALCLIAGVRVTPLSIAAAEHALQVAAEELGRPGNGFLFMDGGWISNRRRETEDFLWRGGPMDPPGTETLLSASPVDFLELGRLSFIPNADLDEIDVDTIATRGRQLALRLLDWALAAATLPPSNYSWAVSEPKSRGHRTQVARWIATAPMPGGGVPLQLRVNLGGDGVHRYGIHPGPNGVPEWTHEAEPALRFGNASSLVAAQLMAEHAASDALAQAPRLRTADRRLLIPAAVPDDATPTIGEVISAVDTPEHVLDLYEVVARLRMISEWETRHPDDPQTYGPPADGHFVLNEDSEWGPSLGTLTSAIADDSGLPATHPGEPANTSAVDSAEFRRHLARHRCALDPVAECYLAAADAVEGPAAFSIRHATGLAALRAADLQVLTAADPRPNAGADTEWAVANLPVDIAKIEPFFNTWYADREGE